MDKNHSTSEQRREEKRKREESLKRMVASEKERKRRRDKALKKRHYRTIRVDFYSKIEVIFNNIFPLKSKSNNEILKNKFIESKLKSEIKAKRAQRIKEFIIHPFGRSYTKLEKQELAKKKLIENRLKLKIRAKRLTTIIQNIRQSISSLRNPEVRQKLLKLLPTSVSTFILAYISIYLVSNIFTCSIASFWDVDTILKTSVIHYLPSSYSPLWTKGSVVSIYSTQFVVSLLSSFIALLFFLRSTDRSPVVKIYLMWLTIISQAFAWGSFFGGFLRKEGIFHAIQWGAFDTWFSYKTLEIVLMIIGFLWLIIFGYILKPLFIYTTPSATLIKGTNRSAFYQFQYTLPLIIGITVVFIINAPIYNLYILLQLLSVFFILFPLIFDKTTSNNTVEQIRIKRPKLHIYTFLALTILVIIFFKIILETGINF